jgi:hypothetical protein
VWLAPQSERRRAILRAIAFVLGVLVGSLVFGFVLGLAGDAFFDGPMATVILVAVTVVTVVVEVAWRSAYVPQFRWQVPRHWLLSRWRGYLVFGVVMGAGAFTRQPSILYYLYPLACLASGSPLLGAVFGGVYGLTFAGLFVYGTIVWRNGPAGGRGDRALALQRYARVVAAVAAPSVVIMHL